MNAADYSQAVRDCLERSWWLRRLKPDSLWLIRQAVAFLADRDACLFDSGPPAKRQRLAWECLLDQYLGRQLTRLQRVSRFRRCVLRWLAVPLVADLVFQWWLTGQGRGEDRMSWAP